MPEEASYSSSSDDEEVRRQESKKNAFLDRVRAAKDRYAAQRAGRNAYGPPYLADYGGDLIEMSRALEPDVEEVHRLLLNKGDPNIGDPAEQDNTAIHFAARYGHLALLQMFKLAGGMMDKANALGVTPLSYTSMFRLGLDGVSSWEDKQAECVTFLLECGANINNVDKGGFSPLAWACRAGNAAVARQLIDAGADVMLRRPALPFRGENHVVLPKADPIAATTNWRIRAILEERVDAILAAEAAAKAEVDARAAKKAANKAFQDAVAAEAALRKAKRDRQRRNAARLRAVGIETLERDKVLLARAARAGATGELSSEAAATAVVWKRHINDETGRVHWRPAKDMAAIDSEHHNVMEEAAALGGVIGNRFSSKVATRWRNLTGL